MSERIENMAISEKERLPQTNRNISVIHYVKVPQ
jgi:hypothetical protein